MQRDLTRIAVAAIRAAIRLTRVYDDRLHAIAFQASKAVAKLENADRQ